AVGVLLMVGFGLVAAVLQIRATSKVAVLAVAHTVPAGQVIRAGDLSSTDISAGSGLKAIAAADRPTVLGRTAAVPLLPGTLLTRAAIADGTTVTKGKVVVGLSLKPGQLPTSQLKAGDQVLVVATGSAAQLVDQGETSSAAAQDPRGAVLVRQATVFGIEDPGRNSDNSTVSLLVDEREAPALAGAANVGQVTVVLRSAS
ncbi:MAG: hypothetical protein JWP02_1327, partial [Acidimicrobiales bacterium]|nr:hypothetical protein [Acidimicrobiales bacterium]